MGMLNCSRRGCSNIMCYRYSPQYGYICDDCFDELVALGSDMDIERFLEEPRGTEYQTTNAFDYFDDIFSVDD